MNVIWVVKYLAVSVVLWWTEGQGDWVLVLHHVLDGDGKGFICSLEIVEEVFLTDTTPFMGTLPYPLRGIIYDNINLKFFFSDFCCTFAMSLMILLVLICSTKVSENSDMAKS